MVVLLLHVLLHIETLCRVCCNGPCALYYGADGGAMATRCWSCGVQDRLLEQAVDSLSGGL